MPQFTQTPGAANKAGNHDLAKRNDHPENIKHSPKQRGLNSGFFIGQTDILQLQKTIGNRAVMQFLETRRGQRPADMPAQTNTPLQLQKYQSTSSEISQGVFEVDLNEGPMPLVSPTAYGVDAKITFTPNLSAPDMKEIKLVQVVRAQENNTNQDDIVWTGGEERREKTKTTAGTGIVPGFFVDHFAAGVSPREDKITGPDDPAVPAAYIDQKIGGKTHIDLDPSNNSHGSKQDGTIVPAKMHDTPSSEGPYIFTAETVAQTDIGNIGVCNWDFTTEKGTGGNLVLKNKQARFKETESDTFKAALSKFNDVYRNPGSNLSPEHIKDLITEYKGASSTRQGQIKTELKQIVAALDQSPGERLAMILKFMHGINLP